MKTLIATALCALLWGACSSPNEIENPAQNILVIAYLVPGQDAQVKLRQTLLPERYYDGLEDTLFNARVEISTQGEVYALQPIGQERGLYSIEHALMPVVEGQRYQLLVEHDGRLVRAETTVPFASQVTEVKTHTGDGENIVYNQQFGDLFGNLVHPGEFFWSKSPNAAGYVVIVEAVDVRSLPPAYEPLTADLDTLIALRERLEGQVSADSLAALAAQIDQLRNFFAENISLISARGDTLRYLRDRQQEEWDEIADKEWTEGKKWRERRDKLFFDSKIDYWIPADSTRSDFWWLGVRFEGEYRVRLQAADLNYYDYYTTAFNGQSGSDGDKGPVFHVEGGTGVFGSYTEDSFRVIATRNDSGIGMKIAVERDDDG